MTQGMSEDEVTRKLYGEFGERAPKLKEDRFKGIPEEKAISIKPKKRTFSIKSITIFGVAFIVLLIFIIGFAKSRSKLKGVSQGEVAEIKGYLVQGKKYYNDGLFDEAILVWKNILQFSPNHRSALRYIERAELKKKELNIREEETSRKLKEMLARREREEKEKLLQEKERQLKIELSRCLKEGDRYFGQKDFPMAIATYEKALSLSPGNYHAVKNIARAREKMAKEKSSRAVQKKEEVSKEAVSPPPKERGTYYTVQVATYADKNHADDLVKKLTDKGYGKVSVKKVSASSARIWYCVYLGNFSNKEDAAREMEKIKKEGFKDSFVLTAK